MGRQCTLRRLLSWAVRTAGDLLASIWRSAESVAVGRLVHPCFRGLAPGGAAGFPTCLPGAGSGWHHLIYLRVRNNFRRREIR